MCKHKNFESTFVKLMGTWHIPVLYINEFFWHRLGQHLKYWMTLFYMYPAWVLPAEKLCNNLFLITCYIWITKISFSKLIDGFFFFRLLKKKNRYQNCVHGKIFKSVLYCFDLIRINGVHHANACFIDSPPKGFNLLV